jgi:hypothetical protein
MPDKRFLVSVAMLSAAIGGIDFLANEYSLYYEIAWLDLLAHGLSGLLVSLVAFVFYERWHQSGPLSRFNFFLINAVIIIIIAVLWEVLERIVDVSLVGGGATYWSDTASDILVGFIGAQIGYLFLIRAYKRMFV